MRVIRPLFTCLAVLLLFSNIAFSQSSIYEDAKELAEMVKENKQSPIFDFSKTRFAGFPKIRAINLKHGGKQISTRNINQSTYKYEAQEVGIYEFSLSEAAINSGNGWSILLRHHDTLNLILGDSIVQIFGDTSINKIRLNYSPANTKITVFYNHRTPSAEVIYSVDGYFIDILKILNAQINIKQKKLDNRYFNSFEDIAKSYRNNPFFDRRMKDRFSIDEGAEKFILNNSNLLPKMNKNKKGWEELMYGDSTLEFEKTVSFQDVSVNYRDPITSKNELDIANTRINETSKNRGFLDAKTVAVGLSDFIAERAQEELNLTFFQRFKENLDKDSELTVLFPNTKKLLYQFEISNYKTLLSNARESFTVDLDNMGLNFPKVLELDKYKSLNNSPEVFNLALIYSIADLAYREVPVEQILIAGYKKLENRKVELGKSIDKELAQAILFPKQKEDKKDKKKSKKKEEDKKDKINIIKGTELSTLQNHVTDYLELLDSTQHGVSKNLNSFKSLLPYYELNITETTAFQNIKRTSIKENYQRYYNQLVDMGSKYPYFEGALIDNLRKKEKIIYANREIKEDSILNFYQNMISANLNQKEYFDYFFDQPSIEDYDLVFEKEPKTESQIVAQGFAITRDLLNENFDQLLTNRLNHLKKYTSEAKTLKKELLRFDKMNEGTTEKMTDFVAIANLQKYSIDQEIDFWEAITGKDKTNHDIAALHYIKALNENDDYVELFETFLYRVNRDPDKMDIYINEWYYNSLGRNFQGTLEKANQNLDSIQIKLTKRVELLTTKYGNRKINPEAFKIKSNHAELILKKQEVNLLKQKEEAKFIEKRDSVGEILYEEYSQLPAYISMKKSLDSLSSINQEILTKAGNENREPTEEEQNLILSLERKSEAKMAEQENFLKNIYEKSVNKIESDLKKERDKKLAPLNLQLHKLNNPYDDLQLISTATDSFPRLKNVYKLSDNDFLKKFNQERIKQTQIDSTQLESFVLLENDINAEMENLKTLAKKKRQLNNYLVALENEYCKGLVDAKDNATNLSKGLELSTHILLAFRDYENIATPITYQDTARIILTKNKVDSTKGFILGTSTMDSLNIQEKIIKETAIDTTIANWITFEKFDALRRNPIEWNLFLGLLYQRLSSIEDAPQLSAQGTALLATKFFSIANDMEETRTRLRIKKAKNPSAVNFKDYYPFIRSTVDLFNTIITTRSIGDSTLQDTYISLKNIPQISNQALSLYENIYVKEYGNAILNSMELLKIITENKLSGKEERRSTRAINAVLIYGTFMANMVNAQTSEQVKNILKSATLPPGSSRIKRETSSSFTINSYLGAAVGRDRLLDVPANIDIKQDAFGASLSVPIGFTYSFSPNFIKNNSSFSIHVPLIDLGAITAYRQNPKNTSYSIDNLPDFSWNNLFSPGAFVVYNFANSPFSLGVGGQYGPQLREIKLDTGDAINVNSWRFPMAFFTIDVPFFNLYTGSRKVIVN